MFPTKTKQQVVHSAVYYACAALAIDRLSKDSQTSDTKRDDNTGTSISGFNHSINHATGQHTKNNRFFNKGFFDLRFPAQPDARVTLCTNEDTTTSSIDVACPNNRTSVHTAATNHPSAYDGALDQTPHQVTQGMSRIATQCSERAEATLPQHQHSKNAFWLHLVWCGELSKVNSYLNDVYQLKAQKPEANIIIWADFNSEAFKTCLQLNKNKPADERIYFLDLNEYLSELAQIKGLSDTEHESLGNMLNTLWKKEKSYAATSDIIRNLLAYNFGGLYVDFDDVKQLIKHHNQFEQNTQALNRSLESNENFLAFDANMIVKERNTLNCYLLSEVKSDYAVYENPERMIKQHFLEPREILSNNIIISTPKHPFFISAFREILGRWQDKIQQNNELGTTRLGKTRREKIESVTHLTGMWAQQQSIEQHSDQIKKIHIPCRSDQTWVDDIA